MYNHYLRLDKDGIIVKAFSDSQEKPIDSDVLFVENTKKRNFYFQVTDQNGSYLNKYENGAVVPLSYEEKFYKEFKYSLLDSKRYLALKKVDDMVSAKIGNGFSCFGHIFSLSQNAQINWTNLRANKDLLTFPVECSIQDSPYIYYIEEENIDALVGAVLNAVKTILEHARAAKLGIQALTTIEAVEAYQIVI